MKLIYMDDLWRWFMWRIYLWDLHVDEIFMRFTCGWYIQMWMIYEIHMCWNWLIKVLKFKHLQFCSKINMVSEHRTWSSLVLCNNLNLHRSWRVEQNIVAMTLISIWPEYHFESTSNFITWKARVLNILEEHNLDFYVSSVVEDPTTK